MSPSSYYVGVDVGTGSVRAAVIDSAGAILGLSEKPISRTELKENFITQSSTEIWEGICYTVKTAVAESHIDPSLVLGIGLDATCSLVSIKEANDEPMAVGPDFSNDLENIILWMDHRAEEEVAMINKTGDVSLKYVGGGFSIEMEIVKMTWLKNHMPADASGKSLFSKCKFYDLADYLTHKATGKETRTFCSCVCKQGMVPQGVSPDRNGWSKEFLTRIGVPELAEDNFRRLGGLPGVTGEYATTGETIGPLTKEAADQLGLTTKCYVGAGVIDAYAGWVGTVAANTEVPIPSLLEQDATKTGLNKAAGRLAAIAGTSTCHICIDDHAIFVPGVWGPYRDALGKGYWCAEGGQSCTGALLAHVLSTHPAYAELEAASEGAGVSKFDFLNSKLETLKKTRGERSVVALAKNLFFYGDFHGNRSPIADPHMKASIIGQSMDVSLDSLAIEYLGACEFIAQQTRQIVERMEESGYKIQAIYMSGGQCRNGLLMRLLADCTGLPIVIPRYIDASVVFGAAMLGAVAAEDAIRLEGLNGVSAKKEEGNSERLWRIMVQMSGVGKVIFPRSEADPDRKLLSTKYKIFLDQIRTQQEYRGLVAETEGAIKKYLSI
ncbi:DEKNAAC105287 [Brettanomyces naardenensis]|uniref:DEKNAAC105287 n=1 Tax=Brettanomyces naardenensis TaxID=13370 RepID=A0A448YST2_BRENA|nr:DEKNAAC105287 [Brettanomyces naardenensis]